MDTPISSATSRIESPESMRSFGAELAGVLPPGFLLRLSGPLGAGKTTLSQGVAAGLGVTGPIPSPSYTLVREYSIPDALAPRPGRLLHADLYRCGSEDEVRELALDEALDEGAVLIVEWPENAGKALPDIGLWIRIVPEAEDELRSLRVEARDHEASALLDGLMTLRERDQRDEEGLRA